MTAEIWNTYDLAIAATTGGLIVGVATVGLMVLKRLDGAREMATAKGWWEKAIKVQEANDRARWAPAYSENRGAGPAIEAELLHVEHATGELPALSDQSHADEQADQADTDRTGMWRVIGRALLVAAVVPLFVWSWCVLRPLDRLRDAVADWQQTRRERDQVGGGDGNVVLTEPRAELESAAEIATPVMPEPVRIVRNTKYRRLGDTGMFPHVKVVGDKAAGRHRLRPEPEMPAINASIPTQRDGEVSA